MWKWSLLLLLLAAASCKKQHPDPYQPGTYPRFGYGGITHFGGFRLYTSGGEITNPALVQQYASEFTNFFYTPGSTYNDPAFHTFALVSEDSIWNLSTVPVGEAGRKSTGTYDRFTGKHWTPVNDTNDLVLHLMKYPLFDTATTAPGLHYLKAYTPAYVMKHVGDTLFFPINRFVQISRTPGTAKFYADRFNNVFEPAGLWRMEPTDTMLVQSFDLKMVKEK